MAGLRENLFWLKAFLAIILLTALGLCDAATCYKYFSADDYPNCITLDSNLVLHWRIIGGTTLDLAADGDGNMCWLAIGISEMGLRGVDYNVVIRGTTGYSWTVSDFFAVDNSTPAYDQEQNAVLESSPSIDKNNHTAAVLQRPLDSCDANDTPVPPNVERSLVWAYNWGNCNWDKDKATFPAFVRGIRTGVKLYTTSPATVAASSSTSQPTINGTVTVAMPAFPVPASGGAVQCVNLPLPNDTSYQVVAYQGFNTTPFVTRVMGYVCAPGSMPAPMGTAYPCGPFRPFIDDKPLLPLGCETLNFVWAPGAGTFYAPPQAGFTIGAGSAVAMVLQVYYQNPGNVVGKTDSSGFNLTYTSALRGASLGVLTLGNVDLRIPAATPRFDAPASTCPASCTDKRVLADVTLFSNFVVMGRLGTAFRTRHIRNSQAMPPVDLINYWDRNYMGYQSTRPDTATLRPGDTLITTCSYDTSATSNGTVIYGNNAGQEVCFNYITFYPLSAMPDLDYCVARTYVQVNTTATCATRSAMALAANKSTNPDITVPVGTVNIKYYKSEQCIVHDRPPNTKGAIAAIVLVPVVLVVIGAILWIKYSKQEEMEALLVKAREEGLDVALTAE